MRGLRSEPVSSEEPAPPLLHRGAGLCCLGRLAFLGCFWVLSPRRTSAAGSRTGSESRDEDDVNSEGESVVEASELAMALACVYARGRANRAGCGGVAACAGSASFLRAGGTLGGSEAELLLWLRRWLSGSGRGLAGCPAAAAAAGATAKAMADGAACSPPGDMADTSR